MSSETTIPASGNEASWQRYPIVLLLAGLCVYYNSIGGTYFIDDHVWIVKNPDIGRMFSFFLNNRFMVSTSLTLNYWLDGINPRGYHVFNLAVHILGGLALFGVIRRTLLLPRWSESVRSRSAELAFVIALLWLIHPLNTQAVTYVIQRCESLMGLFYLLTVYCVLRSATSPSGRWWSVAAVLCLIASQGSKEVGWTLPAVVLLYDWTFLGTARQILRRRWSLHLALWSYTLFQVVWQLYGGRATSNASTISFNYPIFTPLQYAMTQTGVILYYLKLSVWPSPLCMDYLDWPIARSFADCYGSALTVGVLLLLTAVGVARRSWIGFLGAWFFLILAPTSSILPIQDPVFEHRMYLSLIAVIALAVAGGATLLERVRSRGALSSPWLQRLTAGLVMAWCLLFGGLTIARNATYCSFSAMQYDMAARRPGNYRAQETLAQVYLFSNDLDRALDHVKASLQLKPDYFVGYNTIGLCFLQQGRLDDAISAFSVAVKLRPSMEADIFHLNLGRGLLLRGELPGAVEQFRAAVAVNPRSAIAHVLLGMALAESGKKAEAAESYQTALRLDPGCARRIASQARADVFAEKPNAVTLRQGLLAAEAACRLTGDKDPEYLDLLAIAFSVNGRYPEAREAGRKALDLSEAAGQTILARQMRDRLALYARKRPYQQEQAAR